VDKTDQSVSEEMDPSDAEITRRLMTLPDEVANALGVWRLATRKKRHLEALAFTKLKEMAIEEKRPCGDDFIESKVQSMHRWLRWSKQEDDAEVAHYKIQEKHRVNKIMAQVRSNFIGG